MDKLLRNVVIFLFIFLGLSFLTSQSSSVKAIYQTCGAKDQPCCSKATYPKCNPGLTCNAALKCTGIALSCGNEGEKCCAPAGCDVGLKCSSGICLSMNPTSSPSSGGGGKLDLDKVQSTALPGFNYSSSTPSQIISDLIPYVFGAAGIVLLLMLLVAGYQILFSRGDPKAMQIAQSRITTSIIGLVILFMSFWIVRILGQFLGIALFSSLFN